MRLATAAWQATGRRHFLLLQLTRGLADQNLHRAIRTRHLALGIQLCHLGQLGVAGPFPRGPRGVGIDGRMEEAIACVQLESSAFARRICTSAMRRASLAWLSEQECTHKNPFRALCSCKPGLLDSKQGEFPILRSLVRDKNHLLRT